MDAAVAERSSRFVGLVTAVAGAALLVSPKRLGPMLDIDDPRLARMIGLTDLALAPGLVLGRPKWPWMAARTVANVATAVVAARQGGTRAWLTAGSLVAVTVADAHTTLTLRRAGR